MKVCLILVSTLLLVSSNMPLLAEQPTSRAGALTMGGRTIRYAEYGRGIATVLVHGGFARTPAFDKQIPALTANFRVVIVEPVGLPEGEQVSRRALRPDDVDALLRHLGIPRGDVVSFSDAGLVGLRLAAEPLGDVGDPSRLDTRERDMIGASSASKAASQQ